MIPSTRELEQIVATVWAAMLGVEVEPSDPTAHAGEGCPMTGCVQIMGAWEGAVVLTCPAPLVRRAAAGVFGIGPAEVTQELARDLLGELTNMVAGNLKALLPEVSHLSLPAVTDGTDYDVRLLGSRLVCCAGFRLRGQAFTALVYEREVDPPHLIVFPSGSGCR